MQRISVIFAAPYRIELGRSAVPAPGAKEVLIKTQVSAISAGTEMLIYRGQLPAGMQADAAIPELARPFAYPIAYGYACVGQIVEVGQTVDAAWLGKNVFCFHPHESHFTARPESLIALPEDLELTDAVFLATMETAVNLLMDGRPVIGEDVVVFGLGIVGLLTAALLSQQPLNRFVAFDPCRMRRERAAEAGAGLVLDPAASGGFDEVVNNLRCDLGGQGADLVYELSGNPAALNQAIAVAGFDSRIVVGSWYGTKKADLDLGSRFHRDRIQLISSQVSSMSPRFSGRWTKDRRIKVALEMIRRLNPGRYITHCFDVQQAREAYDLLDQNPQEVIQILLTYE